MSELRHSRADLPAELPASPDRQADRADARLTILGKHASEITDHRKTAPPQRDFIRKVRDQPPNTADRFPSTIDWKSGQPAEARTVQRTDEGGFEKFSAMDTSRRRGRGIMDKLAEKSDELTEKIHDAVDTADAIFHNRPPTHSVVGVPPPPDLTPPQYGTHTAGDVASALVAGAFTATELSRRMHGKFSDWKDRHGGNG